jgi:hypothetical protein
LSLPRFAQAVLGLGPAARKGPSAGKDLAAYRTEIAPFIRSGQSLRVDELRARGRQQDLPILPPKSGKEGTRPQLIQLARDIVEQEYWPYTSSTLDDFYFRELERNHHRALLALRRHSANPHSVQFEQQIIAVGAHGCRTTCTIANPMTCQIESECLRLFGGAALISYLQRTSRAANHGKRARRWAREGFRRKPPARAQSYAVLHHERFPRVQVRRPISAGF